MNVLVVIGTRPEAIKLWRVIEELKSAGAKVDVLNTMQHEDLGPLLEELGIRPTHRFGGDGPPRGTILGTRLGLCITDTAWLLAQNAYNMVVVQGDTMSALAGALAAFYNKIPVAHVEAGLRTYNLASPFPEEGNRQMISRIASLHFCPTNENLTTLIDEQLDLGEVTLVGGEKPQWCTERAFVVGNTGIDALGMVAKSSHPGASTDVLVTFHRREAWDYVEELAGAVRKIAQQGHKTTWITHGNPALRARVRDAAGSYNASNEPCDNQDGPCQCGAWHKPTDGVVLLRPPLGYKDFVRMLSGARVVITDSGGVVEECISLGRRCIMVRDETERSEALEHGACLVPLAEMSDIPRRVDHLVRVGPPFPSDVFGDGRAAKRIVGHILHFLSSRPS